MRTPRLGATLPLAAALPSADRGPGRREADRYAKRPTAAALLQVFEHHHDRRPLSFPPSEPTPASTTDERWSGSARLLWSTSAARGAPLTAGEFSSRRQDSPSLLFGHSKIPHEKWLRPQSPAAALNTVYELLFLFFFNMASDDHR